MHRLTLLTLACCLPAAVAGGAELAGTAYAGDKPAEHTVVWIDVPNPPPFTQHSKVVLDQRNLAFVPHVLVVRVGTTIEFPNNDKVFHNVFSFRDGKKFDLGMYPAGTARRIVFDAPGLARVFCNIHPKMAAYVMAVDTPYYAVSNAKGAFTIANVPPGSYTYHAWRPGAQAIAGTVTIEANKALEIRW